MTRTKRFINGTLAGYGNIATNVIFTLLTVPLALKYLDQEQFGLWALAVQLNGYLILLGLGVGPAISRFLIDYKDEVNSGYYGAYLLTGGIVQILQGILIGVAGFAISWVAPHLFSVPRHLADDFQWLVISLAGVTGLGNGLRAFTSPLYAFQRLEVIHGCSSISLILSLFLLWLGFESGWGVQAFPLSQLPAALLVTLFQIWICLRNGYYPQKGHCGRPSLAILRKLLRYGNDVLMLHIGAQLVNATQIMIISRLVGLNAAAAYAIATKFFSMATMLLSNPISSAVPGLTELYVRNDKPQFIKRFWNVISISLAGSTVIAVGLVAGNRPFISLWTSGKVDWDWRSDFILGIIVVMRTFNGCLLNSFGISGDWKPIRYVYVYEGITFLLFAVLLGKYWAMTGIIFAALIAHLLTTSLLSIQKSRPMIGWHPNMNKGLMTSAICISFAALYGYYTSTQQIPSILALTLASILSGFCGLIAWRYLLPLDLREEIISRIPILQKKRIGL